MLGGRRGTSNATTVNIVNNKLVKSNKSLSVICKHVDIIVHHLLQFFVVFNLLLCQSLFLNCLLLVLFSGESAKVTVIPPTMAEFTNTMILSSNTYLRSSLDFLIKNCTYMCWINMLFNNVMEYNTAIVRPFYKNIFKFL